MGGWGGGVRPPRFSAKWSLALPCAVCTFYTSSRYENMNWPKQGGAGVLFHQIFSLLWRAGRLIVNYYVKITSRRAESSIC